MKVALRGSPVDELCPDTVLPALRRLDHLLARAVVMAEAVYGPESATDPFRGLQLDRREVDRLLARAPGLPLFGADESADGPLPDTPGGTGPLARLAHTFGLSPFDLDLILVALAPELDLRYERLYAYLQDDVTRRRPSVDLALNLLCRSTEAKLARRAHVAPDAPLLQHGLLHLVPDPNHVHPPLLAHYLKPDEHLVRHLLGQGGLHPDLTACCQLVAAPGAHGELPFGVEARRALLVLAGEAREARQPLRVYFAGPPGAGQRATAEAVASAIGAPLLVTNLARAVAADADFARTLRLLFREALFHNAIIYLDGLDALQGQERRLEDSPLYAGLLDALAGSGGITIFTGQQP